MQAIPGRTEEDGPPGTVKVDFVSANPASRWDVYADDRVICTTPCQQWVNAERPLMLRAREEAFMASPDKVQVTNLLSHSGEGRLQLHLSSAEDLPTFDMPFDKIFSINSIHFWKDPLQSIRRLREMLGPGGVLALTIQPRSRNATAETTKAIGEELVQKLWLAGFTDCTLELRHIKPLVVACAIARK